MNKKSIQALTDMADILHDFWLIAKNLDEKELIKKLESALEEAEKILTK